MSEHISVFSSECLAVLAPSVLALSVLALYEVAIAGPM